MNILMRLNLNNKGAGGSDKPVDGENQNKDGTQNDV